MKNSFVTQLICVLSLTSIFVPAFGLDRRAGNAFAVTAPLPGSPPPLINPPAGGVNLTPTQIASMAQSLYNSQTTPQLYSVLHNQVPAPPIQLSPSQVSLMKSRYATLDDVTKNDLSTVGKLVAAMTLEQFTASLNGAPLPNTPAVAKIISSSKSPDRLFGKGWLTSVLSFIGGCVNIAAWIICPWIFVAEFVIALGLGMAATV